MLLAIYCFVGSGCRNAENNGGATISLTLATTTSTQDSGLLDVLVPLFEQETAITLKVIAVGSGQALELGRRGDADVLFTHSPAAEDEFMKQGFGCQRHPVMYNDFIIVGPATDPADLKSSPSAVDAFTRIAANGASFVSRGDESGTHVKEKKLWSQTVASKPAGAWYIEAGTGMAAVLRIADEKQAYTLADRATYLSQKNLGLTVVFEGDTALRNQYSVIVVRPQSTRDNSQAAQRFSDFLLAPKTQQTIASFGVKEVGEPLFFPNGMK